MAIKVIQINTKEGCLYAIRYSFLGMFKQYKSFSSDSAWWSRHDPYFDRCVTNDLKLLKQLWDHLHKPKFKETETIVTNLEKVLMNVD
jgi:hypothetical protein